RQIDQHRTNPQLHKTPSLNLQTIHHLHLHPIKNPHPQKTINHHLPPLTPLLQNYPKLTNPNNPHPLKPITPLKLQIHQQLKTPPTNPHLHPLLKRFNVPLTDIQPLITQKQNTLLRIHNIPQQT
ncbi:hypothetical protein, partial [Staphylococcus aureus]|uniref:hypothetical protein n=1 Tax=Staphylococcus aureus TaxID=1280 RepID=UPI0016425218